MKIRNRGFTVVELVVIIVLLGVVSVTALARVQSPASFAGPAFAEELRSALRFAQKFAVSSGCDVQASVDGAADTYALHLRADATGNVSNCLSATGAFGANPLRNPATGQAFAGAAPTDVSISGSLTTVFNGSGNASVGGSVMVGSNTINVVAGSGLVQ